MLEQLERAGNTRPHIIDEISRRRGHEHRIVISDDKILVIRHHTYGLHDEEYLKLKILMCTLPPL